MVIVDTIVWIDYLRGVPSWQVKWLERELYRQQLGIFDLVLCELLQGVSTDRQADELQRNLEQFILFEIGSKSLSIAAARNYRFLRSKGITIRRTIDCLIATYCIQNKHTLLHNDQDFDAFEEYLSLSVVHP